MKEANTLGEIEGDKQEKVKKKKNKEIYQKNLRKNRRVGAFSGFEFDLDPV